jgi:tetratricopeptide (TPR) repeat protein
VPLDDRLADLRDRLLQYRADRHPFEHATLQFHLGATLLDAGRAAPACVALHTAVDLFEAQTRPVEHAKALNLLGAAQQQGGSLDEAAETLERAAELFDLQLLPSEHAAARFNLGLVRRQQQRHAEAAECFERALDRFLREGLDAQAGAAARELGATRFELDDLEAAVDSLEHAHELARATGHRSAIGGAANLLGLAHLAANRSGEAIEAFVEAVDAYPRQLDPDSYAMATANLALAHEQAGDAPHARLAARRALRTPGAAAAVTTQASAVLERLGTDDADLVTVLAGQPRAGWVPQLRSELTSVLDAEPDERRRVLAALIAGQLDGPLAPEETAAAYLEVLLELPPRAMDHLVRATIEALRPRSAEERATFRSQVSRAMVRFHPPQWKRLEHTFQVLGTELGDDGTWT